jgi:hypothetical protein
VPVFEAVLLGSFHGFTMHYAVGQDSNGSKAECTHVASVVAQPGMNTGVVTLDELVGLNALFPAGTERTLANVEPELVEADWNVTEVDARQGRRPVDPVNHYGRYTIYFENRRHYRVRLYGMDVGIEPGHVFPIGNFQTRGLSDQARVALAMAESELAMECIAATETDTAANRGLVLSNIRNKIGNSPLSQAEAEALREWANERYDEILVENREGFRRSLLLQVIDLLSYSYVRAARWASAVRESQLSVAGFGSADDLCVSGLELVWMACQRTSRTMASMSVPANQAGSAEIIQTLRSMLSKFADEVQSVMTGLSDFLGGLKYLEGGGLSDGIWHRLRRLWRYAHGSADMRCLLLTARQQRWIRIRFGSKDPTAKAPAAVSWT